MQINRSASDLWIWGLAVAAVLILILGRLVSPGSPSAQAPAAPATVEAVPAQLEPIGNAPESYPVLKEPRETGLQDAFDQEQVAREPQSGL